MLSYKIVGYVTALAFKKSMTSEPAPDGTSSMWYNLQQMRQRIFKRKMIENSKYKRTCATEIILSPGTRLKSSIHVYKMCTCTCSFTQTDEPKYGIKTITT